MGAREVAQWVAPSPSPWLACAQAPPQQQRLWEKIRPHVTGHIQPWPHLTYSCPASSHRTGQVWPYSPSRLSLWVLPTPPPPSSTRVITVFCRQRGRCRLAQGRPCRQSVEETGPPQKHRPP